jgi:hypothetical protein
LLFTVLHQGVPIARADAQDGSNPLETVTALSRARWDELPGFAGVRDTVEARWAALEPNPPGGYATREAALQHGEALATSLELRDVRGVIFPTERIEVLLLEPGGELVVIVVPDEATAGIPARRRVPPRADGGERLEME